MATLTPTPPRSRGVHRLFAPVDIASLVCFRVVFGAIMLWEVWRYFALGWITRYYIEPPFHFTYPGFSWVRPWPGIGMHLHFALLGLLSICLSLGICYRVSALLFFLGFTYVFLLEQAHYLNHFYLISLLGFLLIFVPAHRALSIDAWRRPALRSQTAPAWALWILRAQLGIVYVYAGLAKLNGDWLRGQPMRMWLAARSDMPLLGRFVTEDWAVDFFSYGGLLFDLFIVPLLLWRRTRLPALVAALTFHLLNSVIFRIGIFPWLAIAATLLFLVPDWPRFGRMSPASRQGSSPPVPGGPLRWGQRLTIGLVAGYLAIQLLVPLRHVLYPGNVSWTEEGHLFAWHMKLRDRQGLVVFLITDPAEGTTDPVDFSRHLTPRQVGKMSVRPSMILQFAHYLADVFRQQGYGSVEVRVLSVVSLNGRKPQVMIDPSVNLAAQRLTWRPASWIVPLTEPLRIHPPPEEEREAELWEALQTLSQRSFAGRLALPKLEAAPSHEGEE